MAEAGDGPLVLLLHGFPEFWWAWRHQLPALADAGYHAVAMDLRGYGASDKPPQGYDTPTLATTSRASSGPWGRAGGGRRSRLGRLDRWSMPGCSRVSPPAVAAVSMAHPLTLRAALAGRRHRRAVGRLLAFQAPITPERFLGDKDGVARLLRAWSGPGWPDAETEERYARAIRLPFVAHTSMEYYRWAVRSVWRADGRRFAAAIRDPLEVPVLQVHGGVDPWVLPETAVQSGSRVAGPLRFELVPAAGHYPHEENPGEVTRVLLDWLAQVRSGARAPAG